MLRCYPHAMIKGILLEISFVMNYPYNGEHQDLSNVSSSNLF